MIKFVLLFYDKSPNFDSNEMFNEMFLKSTLDHLTNLFQTRGYLTVAEVAEHVGCEFNLKYLMYGWIKTYHKLNITLKHVGNGKFVIECDAYQLSKYIKD